MEVVPAVSVTVLLGTGGVHGSGSYPLKHCVIGYWRCTWRWSLTSQALWYWVLAMYMEVVSYLSSTVLWGTGGVHGGGVLAVYMEVVSNLSSTVLWSTGGVHGGGVLAVYKEVVPAVSVTVLLGAGGVHGGGSYPLNHCVIGCWRCTWRWFLPFQVLYCRCTEVCPVFSITVILGTGCVHGSGLPSQSLWCWVLAVYMEVEYWRCTWRWSLPSQTLWC